MELQIIEIRYILLVVVVYVVGVVAVQHTSTYVRIVLDIARTEKYAGL